MDNAPSVTPRRAGRRRLPALATFLSTLAAGAASLVGAPPAIAAGAPLGVDVSHYQGTVHWATVRKSGIRFAVIKATEGTTYRDSKFSTNYSNAKRAGLIRGAYHFALPNRSSGATQANYFISHGGGWSRDNHTLPGVLDIEYNPYGSTCYGKSHSAMRSWIASFVNRYHTRTGRWAIVYSTYDWWRSCTGNSGSFSKDPLWLARYASSPGTVPAGWHTWTCWQYTSSASVPGIAGKVDKNKFHGTAAGLLALANNT